MCVCLDLYSDIDVLMKNVEEAKVTQQVQCPAARVMHTLTNCIYKQTYIHTNVCTHV